MFISTFCYIWLIKKKPRMKSSIWILCIALALALPACKGCKKDKAQEETGNTTPETLDQNTFVKGYGILARLPGIWNGPVNSTTAGQGLFHDLCDQ